MTQIQFEYLRDHLQSIQEVFDLMNTLDFAIHEEDIDTAIDEVRQLSLENKQLISCLKSFL